LRGVGRQTRVVERQGAQVQGAGGAMRDDMQGVDAGPPRQCRQDLLQAVGTRIEDDDLTAGAGFAGDGLVIRDIVLDKDDFSARHTGGRIGREIETCIGHACIPCDVFWMEGAALGTGLTVCGSKPRRRRKPGVKTDDAWMMN
jgi:hypothetical protein